jgi:DNA-binding MarR family transcriptional regulator
MDTREKILHYISERDGTPQNWLKEELDISRSRVSQLLSDMEEPDEEEEEEGLITREKKGREKWVYLTRKGSDQLNQIYQEELNKESPRESTPKQSEYSDPMPGQEDQQMPEAVDFHKTVIRCEIENLEQLKEKYGDKWGDFWGKGMLERKGVKYQTNKYNNAVNYYEGGYEIWFTNEYAFIRLDDYRAPADDIYRRCQTVMAEGMEAVDFLEEVTDVQVDRSSAEPCFSVNEQHIALVEEALAQLVVDHPDADLSRFKIFIDGELRMWIDNSDGEAHLETRGVGKGADDLHFIFNEVYRSFIDNKDGWRQVIDLAESEEDVSELPDRVKNMEAEVSKVEKNVSTLAESLDQVVEVVENHNNGSNGQIQKQVMQVKNTQEQLQEQIQDNTSIQERNNAALVAMTQQLEEIKNGLQEESSSYDDPVQEIFMETWKDPDYNRPFFRDAADGGEHLCAFKSDGSDFEIILKSETVERLRG